MSVHGRTSTKVSTWRWKVEVVPGLAASAVAAGSVATRAASSTTSRDRRIRVGTIGWIPPSGSQRCGVSEGLAGGCRCESPAGSRPERQEAGHSWPPGSPTGDESGGLLSWRRLSCDLDRLHDPVEVNPGPVVRLTDRLGGGTLVQREHHLLAGEQR